MRSNPVRITYLSNDLMLIFEKCPYRQQEREIVAKCYSPNSSATIIATISLRNDLEISGNKI